MDDDTIRSAVLEAVEASLNAQLKAVRSLRAGKPLSRGRSTAPGETPRRKGRSHINMAHAILLEADAPLHVTDIIKRIASRFDVRVDRESLVSALSKRVMRQDRFLRTGRNTFALIKPTDLHTEASVLAQGYLDHWQIEVNHREEKTTFGIGEAQVRHKLSVPRQPAFAVAVYSVVAPRPPEGAASSLGRSGHLTDSRLPTPDSNPPYRWDASEVSAPMVP